MGSGFDEEFLLRNQDEGQYIEGFYNIVEAYLHAEEQSLEVKERRLPRKKMKDTLKQLINEAERKQ